MVEKLVHGPAADGTGNLTALETICRGCDGTGLLGPERDGNVFYQGGQCSKCHGAGTILTEDGKRLKAFLLRHP